MTRTNKWTVHEKQSEPRYFTHNGHYNMNPHRVCKNGNGKYNWGMPGDELMDDSELSGFSMHRSGRRNSNHNDHEQMMKAKEEACDAKLNIA